ncbi:unnamed protein product [Allacma fusca]|uniref:Uncharacterized protein n=1 Tax=Allacma fusca TaxID=39272 RepID=A0A8J2PAG8_9HEXA|nr:unnamed protein product [Allacma fusca]
MRVVAQVDERYKSTTHAVIINDAVQFIGGVYVDVLLDLQKMLNFRILPIVGKGWVKLESTPNGSFLTGMGEQVIAGEADISISKNSLLMFRVERLCFLPPISISPATAFYREPIRNRNSILTPFKASALIALGLLWIMITASFIILFSKHGNESLYGTIVDAVFSLVNAISLQGWTIFPTQFSLQVLCLTAIFSSSLIHAYYTASFVATISAPLPLIHRFSDFLKYGYRIFTNPTSPQYAQDFINDIRILNNVMSQSKSIFRNNEDAILKIAKGEQRFALIYNGDGLLNLALRNNASKQDLCRILSMKAVHNVPIKDGMFLRKGTPFKEIFTHRTILLTERGHVRHHFNRNFRDENNHCSDLGQRVITPINFQHGSVAFEILVVGFAISVASFVLECRIFSDKSSRSHLK